MSVFIHYRCSTNWGPANWNNTPNNIDNNRDRLWDWYDIQFLRGLCPEPLYEAPRCWLEPEPHSLGTLTLTDAPKNEFEIFLPKGIENNY
jgi:hypothetical protein